jgi:hypothetical protein
MLKYTFEGVSLDDIEGPVVLDLRESFGPLAGNVGDLLGRPPFE